MSAPAWIHKLAAPKGQVWFNGLLWMFWLAMIPVTLTFHNLGKSVLYVSLLSVWALFATHLGAWISSLVQVREIALEEKQDEDIRMDELESRLLEKIRENNVEILAGVKELLGEDGTDG